MGQAKEKIVKSTGKRRTRGAKNLLTDSGIRAIRSSKRKPGRYSDGDRLYLVKRDSGKCEWVFRFKAPSGRTRDMALGPLGTVEVAQARELAEAARLLLRQGIDPLEAREEEGRAAREAEAARKAEKARERATLAAVARDYHARKIEPQLTSKHAAQWIASLENHVPPTLWHKPIDRIDWEELEDWLSPLRRQIPETANRICQRLIKVFADSVKRGRCASNPALAAQEEMREESEGKAARTKQHFRALPYAEVPAFVKKLREQPGVAARALEFAILTASRTSEVLNATWDEFDASAGVWTVPAARMKAGEEHKVYLPKRAVEILEGQRELGQPFVFPSPMLADKPLSNMSMLVLLTRMGARERTTVHGLCRTTFSTWANERNRARPDVIEAALAHSEGDKVRAAYNQAKLIEERKALAKAWGTFVNGREPAKVIRPRFGKRV